MQKTLDFIAQVDEVINPSKKFELTDAEIADLKSTLEDSDTTTGTIGDDDKKNTAFIGVDTSASISYNKPVDFPKSTKINGLVEPAGFSTSKIITDNADNFKPEFERSDIMEENLITTKEAAQILGVSRATLENWRVRKLFGVPFFTADEKRGDTWYYDRERILQLKELYNKGILQNMYRLAKLNSENFQKPSSSDGIQKNFLEGMEVAEILNVDESTLREWNKTRYWAADFVGHEGTLYYNEYRVYELKARRDAEKQIDSSTNGGLGKEGSEKPAQIYGKPIFGLITITSADVAKIAAMSAQEKIALKVKINQLDLRRVFGVDRQHKGFICPVCGNGSGRSGDGIVAQIDYDKNGNWYYWHKCFTCDNFNGKLTDILKRHTNEVGKKYLDLIYTPAVGAKMLELAESNNFEVSALPPVDDELTDEQKAEIETLIREDIVNAQNFIEQLPASDRRDLTLATLKHFGCGYLPQWIHPKNRVRGQAITPSRRIIIPSGLNSYNAVMLKTDRTPANKKYWKMKAGEQAIFNAESICAGEIVIIVEGEIDAMSIWQATGGEVNVVAVGGTSNKKLFISYVNEKFSDEEKISCNFIVLLDNDAAGRDNAQKFVDALKAEGYPAAAIFLSDSDEKVDANDILINEGDEILKIAIDYLLDAAQVELSQAHKNILENLSKCEPPIVTKEQLQLIDAQIESCVDDARTLIGSMDGKDFSPEILYDDEIIADAAILKVFDKPKYLTFKGELRKHKIFIRDFEDLVKPSEKIFEQIQADINGLKNQHKNFADKNSNALTQEQRKKLFEGAISDLANARRLAYLFGNELRYIKNSSKWMTYNGQYWGVENNSRDVGGIIYPYTARLADILEENADSEREHKIAATFTSTDRANGAIKYLKAVTEIIITRADLNTHKNLLNCKNGVVDLQTKKLYPHAPELLLTQQVNGIFRAGYRNGTVEKFLRDILPDEMTRAALLRFLGYSLTGEVNEEKSLFIHGAGGNGKGTLTQTLLRLVNNYATPFPIEAVLARFKTKDANAATPVFAQLEFIRLAIAEEIPQGERLDAAKYKLLTGGDPIPVRRLHEEASVIEDPTHKMIFSGNFMPELDDNRDEGLLRRLIVIEFTQSFTGEKADIHLKQKLLSSDALSGLLTLLVDNAAAWYSGGLLSSSAMERAKKEYLRDQDFILDFIEENCVKVASAKIRFMNFIERLREKSKTARRMTDRALRDTVTRKLSKIDSVNKTQENGVFIIHGLGWKVDDTDRYNFEEE